MTRKPLAFPLPAGGSTGSFGSFNDGVVDICSHSIWILDLGFLILDIESHDRSCQGPSAHPHGPGKVARRPEIGGEIGDSSPCARAHPTMDEKAILPLGGDHRHRYRSRYRLSQTDTTDCDCDCDPDTDPDAFGFLLLFSEQSPSFPIPSGICRDSLGEKRWLSPISLLVLRLCRGRGPSETRIPG